MNASVNRHRGRSPFLMRLVLAAFGALLPVAVSQASAATDDRPAPIVLENEQIALTVDAASGVFTQLRDVKAGITLMPAPGLAENFRLTLLLPDQKAATILGKDQKLSKHTRDGQRLTLEWARPLTDTTGSAHDIIVRMDIAMTDDTLGFTGHVKNKTAFKIEQVWYPLVGGLGQLHASGQPPDATLWVPISEPSVQPLAHPFRGAAFAYPGQMNMAFTAVQSPSAGRSLYFAAHDTVARYKTYRFDELSGPKGQRDVFACIQHHPYIRPGEEFTGAEVAVSFLEGDWHAAGQKYRAWFQSAFGITQPAQCWIRRESFFLMTMFMLPEGTITLKFKDIPAWARAAKACGINSLQISGWQVGGHDNGYPDYTPDPRLGTWAELEAGIKECHKLGMKVYFFVNYQPMMLETDWYKNDLQKYREMGPHGELTWNAGWGMGTLWARMDHPKKMTWAELAFPQFRQIIVRQFAKLAEIGGDGVHVDKMFPVGLEFNPDAPLSPDSASWEGAITLTKEIMAECRKHNPEWAMSFECNWDRLLQFTGATWWVGNQKITRQVFPEHAETLGLYQAYDYLGVNNAVRDGHIVMVAPLNFCRNVDWPPFAGLADYIREMKPIRDRLQETVFYGEILGPSGVQLTDPPADGIQYNVFRHRENGRHVCIVTNSHMKAGKLALAGFAGKTGGKVRVHAPEAPNLDLQLPANVDVPGERIVFIEEVTATPLDSALEPLVKTFTEPKLTKDAHPSLQLEDENCLLEFSGDDGRLRRLFDKKGNLELIKEPRLAASFKFALPIPGKEPWQTIEANWIVGQGKTLAAHELQGHKLTLHWRGPLTNYLGDPYDVSVTEIVELVNGGVLFNLTIDNASGLPIGETYFPMIGGINGLGTTPEQCKATKLIRPGAKDTYPAADIFRNFTNMSWLGDQGPEQFYACPGSQPEPWLGFGDAKGGRSVCVGALSAPDKAPVIRLELKPASSGTQRDDGNWPRPEELGSWPVGVELSFVDCAGGPANQTYHAAPVFVQFVTGDGPQLREAYSTWQSKIQSPQK